MTDTTTLRERADQFAKEFSDTAYEMGHAQNFVRELCAVYQVPYLHAVLFEHRVLKGDGSGINRIDGLFPSLLLVEMKSAGKNMADAYEQAYEYIPKLPEADRPRYVLVSDFQRLALYDLSRHPDPAQVEPDTFALAEFPNHVEKLNFLSGFERIIEARQEAANREAAEKLADLHDALRATGYAGEDLEKLLIRILFCLFAEDTDLFDTPNAFLDILNNTWTDGRDISGQLDALFDTLNRAMGQRAAGLYPALATFPYVNGELFAGRLPICWFDAKARTALIEAARIDWSQISPDIFGSLFQAIMHFEDEAKTGKTAKRREFGAHYTSEKNIRKVIDSLFLDDLKAELKKVIKDVKGSEAKRSKTDGKRFIAFMHRLRELRFFDPACGCGNFLVITYREIRLLEEEAREAYESATKLRLTEAPLCDVDQFYGIEIDPTAAQIATVAMWLTDHQMNRRLSLTGKPYRRLPLKAKASIVCGNALRLEWREVCPKADFIMGNPPFVGKKEQIQRQKDDMDGVFNGIEGTGILDYVASWYVTAARYIAGTTIPVAFVSTNSITQGEQVGALWRWLLNEGVKIRFAHRTFRWSNEGRGIAAVHCVIIGFGLEAAKTPVIFDYGNDISGEPLAIGAKNINPYLVNAPVITLENRKQPICNVPAMRYGSMPIDKGHLILSAADKAQFMADNAKNLEFIRRYMGGDEFLNDIERYCIWLADQTAGEHQLGSMIDERIERVKKFRLDSGREATQKLAATPGLFGEIRQPSSRYLLLPKVSSENRVYMPIGFIDPDVIANGSALIVPKAGLLHFGVLQSVMHMAWMRAVCGRLESRYQYSASIVYNNFPWPAPTDSQKAAIETAAQGVLDAREAHPGQSLAWLYNKKTMPDNIKAAHETLDKAVDSAYGYKGKPDDDAKRVAFLFKQYQRIIEGKST